MGRGEAAEESRVYITERGKWDIRYKLFMRSRRVHIS